MTKTRFLQELVYAQDLVLITDCLENIKFRRWKEMESRGLKVNVDKTKVMIYIQYVQFLVFLLYAERM